MLVPGSRRGIPFQLHITVSTKSAAVTDESSILASNFAAKQQKNRPDKTMEHGLEAGLAAIQSPIML